MLHNTQQRRPFRKQFSGNKSKDSARPSRREFPEAPLNPDQYVQEESSSIELKSGTHFNSMGLFPSLVEAIEEKGFTQATEIQSKVIAPAISGRDILGLAHTGGGKTLGFLIPIIQRNLERRKDKKMFKSLVIAPTRELAQQIDRELKSLYIRETKIFSTCCVGGESIGRQIRDIKRVNHVVIGTPGRLIDLINRKCLQLNEFECVVLDEVDRMLDMGFLEDINFILSKVPQPYQLLSFSATLPSNLEKVLLEFAKDPVIVRISPNTASTSIKQDVVNVAHDDHKLEKLVDLLGQEHLTKVLIFVETRRGAETLHQELLKVGQKVDSMHGNFSQRQRQISLRKFRSGEIRVLVATDVAARGLDVSDITHVINYDEPRTSEDYIHRIGRTGRSGKTGTAITFVVKGKRFGGPRRRGGGGNRSPQRSFKPQFRDKAQGPSRRKRFIEA